MAFMGIMIKVDHVNWFNTYLFNLMDIMSGILAILNGFRDVK
jgi:hypothetical protein